MLATHAVGEVMVDAERRTVRAPVEGGASTLTAALRRLDDDGVGLDEVGLLRPTLDDVFLSLTGRTTAAAEDDSTDTADAAVATKESAR